MSMVTETGIEQKVGPAEDPMPSVIPATAAAVSAVYSAGQKIPLPHDFTIEYSVQGTARLDNRDFAGVESVVIQDKHPMWAELKTSARVTYEALEAKEGGMRTGRIVLTPFDGKGLEVLVTGQRIIPEVDTLKSKYRLTLYSPEIVVVNTGQGTLRMRDIDSVTCQSSSALTFKLETPVAVPHKLYR